MNLLEWASLLPAWVSADVPEASSLQARVLFTRSIRRRNFAGFPFWVSCPPEMCSEVVTQARTFAGTTGFSKPLVLANQSPEAIGFFRERQWLPERPITFPGKRDFKLLFLSSDPAEHALVGEVEHWTQIKVRPGFPETVDIPVTPGLMEINGPFCHSSGYGFLTSNPTFAGSGLQLEWAVHLPALVASRRIQSAQQAMNALGLELQPLALRDPGAAEAGFFRVLSRGGMKFPEEVWYQRISEQVKSVLVTETEALEKWLEKDKHRLEDRIFQSFQLLQQEKPLDYAQFLEFSSFTRVGVYLGHFPASLLAKLEKLRITAQPFHRQVLPSASMWSTDPF